MTDESGKQGAGAPAFSAQDAMAFMQRMWNPFAMPMPGSASGAVAPAEAPPASAGAPLQSAAANAMPGMLSFPNPAAMFAALDPAEVERRIGELKVIENWLRMSLDVIQMSIRTLELQHASLEAMHAGRASSKGKGDAKSRKR
jgi:hypothetical protein